LVPTGFCGHTKREWRESSSVLVSFGTEHRKRATRARRIRRYVAWRNRN
jgi:hypothetical protein